MTVSLPVDGLVEAIARRVVELLREESGATPAEPPDELLSVEEAATYIRAKRQRIYDLINAGKLPAERDGKRRLIRRRALDAYLTGGGP